VIKPQFASRDYNDLFDVRNYLPSNISQAKIDTLTAHAFQNLESKISRNYETL